MAFNNTQNPPDQALPEKLIGRKCRCGLTWCPSCSKNSGVKRFADRIKPWDYRYVRQIVLTIDREQFESPLDAYLTITQKKYIPALLRELTRRDGIEVVDWAWALEWHRDGYPHWHLFVLQNKQGQAGMIGQANISRIWKKGIVWEYPVRSEKHWHGLTGYFAKKGYFEKKKAHQALLPQWARDRQKRVNRTGSKKFSHELDRAKATEKYLRKEKIAERQMATPEGRKLRARQIGQYFTDRAADTLTNGQKLDRCGQSTLLHIYGTNSGELGSISMPYNVYRALDGEYIPGVGHLVDFETVRPFLDWEQVMLCYEIPSARA